MILQKQKEAEILVQGDVQETIGMSLDLDSAQLLMQMLSKNLYSDDIGSAIRETASNALDSHRRAGVTDPIIVGLKSNSSYNYEFTVEDFGLGLDDKDVGNIISKYGKSTKRLSENELGMFGLGFKAPLAYSSSFFFICRKDGIERKYMMYEGEDVNSIDLLYEMPTEERNGVKVIVPIKSNDYWNFVQKMQEQLAYFENVYFDCKDIDNEFIIHRAENFQFSELSKDSSLHLCLDNVYYPIDFSKLGISKIDFPVALRFSLTDGIYPTPNREAIRYTSETKAIILEKIKTVANYFVEKYNKEVDVAEDIVSIITFLDESQRYLELIPGNKLKMNQLIPFSNVSIKSPKLKDIKVFKFDELYKSYRGTLFAKTFSLNFFLNGRTYTDMKKRNHWNVSISSLVKGNIKIMLYEDKLSGVKKEYLRSIKSSLYLAKKTRNMSLGIPSKYDENTYYHFLQLRNYPKEQWRQVIVEYQKIQQMFYDKCEVYEDIDVPQDFIDNLKKTKPSLVKSGKRASKFRKEFTCKEALPLQRWNQGRNCKFESKIYQLEKIDKIKQFFIYDKHENFMELDALFYFANRHNIKLITVNEKDEKLIEEYGAHNMISLSEFMKGDTKFFKRIVTSNLINRELITKYSYLFNKSREISYTSLELSEDMKSLIDYSRVNHVPCVDNQGNSNHSRELMSKMLEIAETNNKFDLSIYHVFSKFMSKIEHLYFLKTFSERMGYYGREDKEKVRMLTDLFKYNKHRVNLEHYKLKNQEDEQS